MFDTHAHLDDEKFNEDRDIIINSLHENGIDLLVNPASDIPSSYSALALAEKYDFIYSAAGVHPHETKNMKNGDLDTVAALLANKKCVAIGEIGLDYFYDLSERDTQRFWFFKQLELAKQLDVPVIIHDREAHAECYEAVRKYGVRGVFHCYSGSAEMATELLKIGFNLSFTGAITFKNARKAIEVIERVPLDRMMIETDSPYLAPVPLRGTRNEPKNVRLVAEKIAEIKGETVEKVIEITEQNGKAFFGIE